MIRVFLAALFSASLFSAVDKNNIVVTASDYSIFLNNEAADSFSINFYDKKMGSDPLAAYITRLGTPGNYHYFVIAGRENLPVTFISENNKTAYCDWSGDLNFISYNDPSLKSNGIDFLMMAPPSGDPSLPKNNPSGATVSTSNQWESDLRYGVIFAGICFTGYKVIKGYREIPPDQIVDTDFLRPLEDTTTQQELSENKLLTKTDQPSDTGEKEALSLEEFHQQYTREERRISLNIKAFHQACITSNKITQLLEEAEKKLHELNKQHSEAKEVALKNWRRYGYISGATKVLGIAAEFLCPGFSFLTHAASELVVSSHAAVNALVDEGAVYAVGEAKSAACGKIVRRAMPSEDVSKDEVKQSDNSLTGLIKWAAGQEVTAIADSLNAMKMAHLDLPKAEKFFLQTTAAYARGMEEVDTAYAAAVNDESEMKINFAPRKRTEGRQSQLLTQGDLYREHSELPEGCGIFKCEKDTTYYRLYAEQDDKEAQEHCIIGAHLLGKSPDISHHAGILIQEVRVPIGTRLQKMTFSASGDLHFGMQQYRLIDIISADCFKKGQLPKQEQMLDSK